MAPSHVEIGTNSHHESSPLICSPSELESNDRHKTTISQSLQKIQLTALCFVRLADPVAFTQIFPYVNEFMSDLHLTSDPSRVGMYSGLVESIFAISQLCSICHWAQLSDRVGRRPVILFGITGLALSTMMFGLSRSLVAVLISRCLAGLFSGNVAVIHSALGESTDSTNQAFAFPIYGMMWPIGSILGPLIGGTFSNPARKFPRLFDSEPFRKNPYFLPCFLAGLVALSGVLFAYYNLKETLPSKQPIKSEKTKSLYGSTDEVSSSYVLEKPLGFRELLSFPKIRSLCASGCALSFIGTAFDVVFVLICYSPIKSGGLNFTPSQIGYSLAIAGALSGSIQLFVFPYLLRRFDLVKMYNFCMALWPFTFAALPMLNLVALNGMNKINGHIDKGTVATVWVFIVIILGMSRIALLAFSINMILVKDSAPNLVSLGTTNGLIQFVMCIARAASPSFVSSVFALSIDNNLLGGHFWVLVMVVISIYGVSLGKGIRQGDVQTR